mgnify:CR=1 FL=1
MILVVDFRGGATGPRGKQWRPNQASAERHWQRSGGASQGRPLNGPHPALNVLIDWLDSIELSRPIPAPVFSSVSTSLARMVDKLIWARFIGRRVQGGDPIRVQWVVFL